MVGKRGYFLILDEVLSVGDGAFRKKSEAKMKEILTSGVTGILVSHSIGQVRSMCNKILWLDHGKQIAFTDEVELYCNAYEEFLQTKKLPQSREDVEQLSAAFLERKRVEREKAQEKEIMKLQAVIETGEKEEVIQASLNVIRKNRPELLIER